VRRGSAIGSRRLRGAHASGMGGFGRGPVGALPFGTARRQASPARWLLAAAPRRDRIGEGERGE
jgi:hypothetical protein